MRFLISIVFATCVSVLEASQLVIEADALAAEVETSTVAPVTTESVATTTRFPRATISNLPAFGPVSLDSPVYEMARRGFQNMGNTCHFNAAVQMLVHSRRLRDIVLPLAAAPLPEEGPHVLAVRVVNTFARVMAEQWADTEEARSSERIVPVELLAALNAYASDNFMIGQMEDAQRSTTLILDALVNVGGPVADAVRALTGSTLHKRLSCNTCAAHRDMDEAVFSLELPLVRGQEMMTLRESIRLYLAEEVVEGVDCEPCAAKRSKTFRNRLTPAPLLVMNVKRLGMYGRKIATFIDYPLEFDMAEYVEGAHGTYRLIGIVHHVGMHYIADFLHPEDGRWYRADDSSVIPFYNYLRPLSGEPHLAGPSQTALLYELI